MYEKKILTILQFDGLFLQSDFTLYFSCCIKNAFFTTLD